MRAWRAWAAALHGVELPGIAAGDAMLLLPPAAMRGGRNPGEEFPPSGPPSSGRGRRSSLGKSTTKENAVKARGEELCRDRARERVSSKASLGSFEASFAKQRRRTGTLKLEISSSSHFFSPPLRVNHEGLESLGCCTSWRGASRDRGWRRHAASASRCNERGEESG